MGSVRSYIMAVRAGSPRHKIPVPEEVRQRGDRMMAYMDSRTHVNPDDVFIYVRGDDLLDFLLSRGAERSDVSPSLTEGGRPDTVARYTSLIETGKWLETYVPIVYNEETGVVGPGADRVAACARVDWTRVKRVPRFEVRIKHYDCYGPEGGRW